MCVCVGVGRKYTVCLAWVWNIAEVPFSLNFLSSPLIFLSPGFSSGRNTLLRRGFQREKEGREGGRGGEREGEVRRKRKKRRGNLCHQAISRWPPPGGRWLTSAPLKATDDVAAERWDSLKEKGETCVLIDNIEEQGRNLEVRRQSSTIRDKCYEAGRSFKPTFAEDLFDKDKVKSLCVICASDN